MVGKDQKARKMTFKSKRGRERKRDGSREKVRWIEREKEREKELKECGKRF